MQLDVISTRYVTGRCEVMDRCPDIRRLRESRERGVVDETLAEQYHELCSVGGYCLTREEILSEER